MKKKNTWFALRKDIFLRDLVKNFLQAKTCFDALCKYYRKTSSISFKTMDGWVGSENKRGPLWIAKDLSHQLFRVKKPQINLYEHLFDWTLGSIFHEAMKLKEDTYQLEAYRPLLEMAASHNNKALGKLINEYYTVIEKASKDMQHELESINQLFSKALVHIQEIFIAYKGSKLLMLFFLNNKRLIEVVFGKNSFQRLLSQIFPEGHYQAYILSAEYCIESGWYDDAHHYLTKALRLAPENNRAQKLLKILEKESQKINKGEYLP